MIEFNEVTFGYNNKDKLFKNIKLKTNSHGIYGILGKNGAGKTSLLNMMVGLVFPDNGICKVMNQTPSRRLPSFLADLYFIPETIYVPALTATDYVTCYAPFYPKFNHSFFENCLMEFDIPASHLLTNLSLGQKKKFLIAFGLATNVRLLILDEPTNGLDIPSKAQFRKLLAETITDEKLFIISTHQVHDVENLIDSVIVLDEGKIIFNETLASVSKQLAIVTQRSEPDNNECLYYEKQLNGYAVVIPNKNVADSHIDLEILFNAIISNQFKMQKMFSEVNI